MNAAEFVSRLDGVKGAGPWVALCPAHEDRKQSLSIGVGDDERVLLNCHAGCSLEEIVGAVNLPMSALFSDPPNGNGKKEIAATYDYVDEGGALLFQAVRFAPKDFRQRRPDGNGGWEWKLGDTRRVLYRLPKVLEAVAAGKRIVVVEGEKDVAALERKGYVATCNAGGAGKWKPQYSESLRGAKVAVITDRDEPGRKHAAEVAHSLAGIASAVKVWEPAEGKDISDHLAAGRSLKELVTVNPPVVHRRVSGRRNSGVIARWRLTLTLSKLTREKISWLWPGRIPLGMLSLLAGDPGLGKSLLTLYLAAKVTRAGADVLLLSAENHATATILPRAEVAGADLDRLHIVRVKRDELEDGIALPDDAPILERLVTEHKARLVVVDPLMAHLPESVNSWRDQSVRRAMAPLHRLAEEERCAVLVVAHLNKAKGADPLYRVGGSIGIPAAVRSALLLARDPEDPDGESGYQRVLAHHKCNVGEYAESLIYRVEGVSLEDGDKAPVIKQIGTSEAVASDLLNAPTDEGINERDDAKEFLRAELESGPKKAKDVKGRAERELGISPATFKRAKKALGVKSDVSAESGAKGTGSCVWDHPPNR